MPAWKQASQESEQSKTINKAESGNEQTWCGLNTRPSGVVNWNDRRSFWRWFADNDTAPSLVKSSLQKFQKGNQETK